VRSPLTQETLFFSRTDSPIGVLTLVASRTGVVAIEFPGHDFPPQRPGKFQYVEDANYTRECAEQLKAYFAGTRREFSVPLDLRGTDFQLQCWHALLDIPYGETRSYAEIARTVGNPQAFRAVGMANHCNPIPIIVPCHRVVAANGTLCGYGGGLDIKRRLLDLERGV